MNKYLAILTSPSGKSFRCEGKAVSFLAFTEYVLTIYPDHEIEQIISL